MSGERPRFLTDCDVPDLAALLGQAGLNPVHAPAVLRCFYQSSGQENYAGALPGWRLKQFLLARFEQPRAQVALRTQAGDGTRKLLIRYPARPASTAPDVRNGGFAECVLMPGYRPGVAAGCVSSQIGCAMGCDFCASTRGGLERDLDAGEIVEQFLHLQEQAAAINRKLRTLVFMGMGEPMLNLDAVMAAIRRIAHPQMGALGGRQITVSTVGIVPGIDRLAEAGLNVHLALSLHAPDDATRARLVPMNRRYAVADILAAARRFHVRTRRVVTIEYCLLAGVNDSDEQANVLVDLLAGFRAHVNLIPYNAIGPGIRGITYARPAPQRMARFCELLRDRGVVAHFRDTRGDDANAACGQLHQQTRMPDTRHAR